MDSQLTLTYNLCGTDVTVTFWPENQAFYCSLDNSPRYAIGGRPIFGLSHDGRGWVVQMLLATGAGYTLVRSYQIQLPKGAHDGHIRKGCLDFAAALGDWADGLENAGLFKGK